MEDFINESSVIPMSSVPIQFLIYVMSEPTCSLVPIILPLTGCLEVTIGVSISFNLYVLNLCDPNIIGITRVTLSKQIVGVQVGNLTTSLTNTSLVYMTYTWVPQEMCTIAYTE